MSTACNTHVFVMLAWVVGRDKHFTQYVVHIPAEAPNQFIRSELFTNSDENPDTGHGTRRPHAYFRGDNTTTTIVCQWRNPADTVVNATTTIIGQ